MTEIVAGVSAAEGGIGALLLGVLTFLGQQYLAARKDKREDVAAERESESGVVETTKETLAIVREEIITLRADRKRDRATITQLEQRLREIEDENYWIHRQLEELRNARNPGYAYGQPSWRPGTDAGRLDRGEAYPGRDRPGGERSRRRYREPGPEAGPGDETSEAR